MRRKHSGGCAPGRDRWLDPRYDSHTELFSKRIGGISKSGAMSIPDMSPCTGGKSMKWAE
jgi:hypothetical protein